MYYNCGMALSDKEKDIAPKSVICVFRTGPCSRIWSIINAEDDEKKPSPVFHQEVTPGTAIFMTLEGNSKFKHGVIAEKVGSRGEENDEQSGSFVIRNIETVLSWTAVDENQAAARKSKKQRASNKKRKRSTSKGCIEQTLSQTSNIKHQAGCWLR